MEKILDYSFGKAFCHDKYVFFERSPNQDLSCEQVQRLMHDIGEHYGKQKFVYISNRKMRTIVDLNAYKHINKKQMAAMAIVTDEPDAEENVLKEQEVFEGPFALFKTLEQAISWASTFALD